MTNYNWIIRSNLNGIFRLVRALGTSGKFSGKKQNFLDLFGGNDSSVIYSANMMGILKPIPLSEKYESVHNSEVMKNISLLNNLFFCRGERSFTVIQAFKVYRFFIQNPGIYFSKTKIAKKSHVSRDVVGKILDCFFSNGLISRDKTSSNTYLYILSSVDFYGYSMIEIMGLRSELGAINNRRIRNKTYEYEFTRQTAHRPNAVKNLGLSEKNR